MNLYRSIKTASGFTAFVKIVALCFRNLQFSELLNCCVQCLSFFFFDFQFIFQKFVSGHLFRLGQVFIELRGVCFFFQSFAIGLSIQLVF